MARGEELLQTNKLSVSFRNSRRPGFSMPVFDMVDLTVRSGEILAIVGASGSGKSLLAHSIVGILPDNAMRRGDIFYQGRKLNGRNFDRLRETVALIPQSVMSLDPLTVVGKQLSPPRGLKPVFDTVDSLMSRLGLSKAVKNMYPSQLSGGMARRILCVIGLAAAAPVIIADEPTAGMDTPRATEILRIFREYAEYGNGIVFITHEIELAEAIADRIAVFKDRNIIETVAAGSVRTQGARGFDQEFSRMLWRASPACEFTDIFEGEGALGAVRSVWDRVFLS